MWTDMFFSLLSDGICDVHGMWASFAVFLGSPDEGLLIHRTLHAAVPSLSFRPTSERAEFSAVATGLAWMKSNRLLQGRAVHVYSDRQAVVETLTAMRKNTLAAFPNGLSKLICLPDNLTVFWYPGSKMKASVLGH